MAESVDATVSNTVGAIRPGSTPGPGTEAEESHFENPHFLFNPTDRHFDLYNGKRSYLRVEIIGKRSKTTPKFYGKRSFFNINSYICANKNLIICYIEKLPNE